MTDFAALIGLTISSINVTDSKEEVYIRSTCGRTFKMHHEQDCCESVYVEDVVGDLSDLIGHPIVRAEERSLEGPNTWDGSETWTFYELATVKGSVTIRWYGSSNGYYSERVDFDEVTDNDQP